MRIDPEPGRRQLRDDPVDLDLGADIDPAGGEVRRRISRMVGFDRSHLASTTFC